LKNRNCNIKWHRWGTRLGSNNNTYPLRLCLRRLSSYQECPAVDKEDL
jgi:hypothetical protein